MPKLEGGPYSPSHFAIVLRKIPHYQKHFPFCPPDFLKTFLKLFTLKLIQFPPPNSLMTLFLVIHPNIVGYFSCKKNTRTGRGAPTAGPPAMVQMLQWLIRPYIAPISFGYRLWSSQRKNNMRQGLLRNIDFFLANPPDGYCPLKNVLI